MSVTIRVLVSGAVLLSLPLDAASSVAMPTGKPATGPATHLEVPKLSSEVLIRLFISAPAVISATLGFKDVQIAIYSAPVLDQGAYAHTVTSQ